MADKLMTDNDKLAAPADWQGFLSSHPDIRHIDAFIFDINGNAVGKRLPREQGMSLFQSGSALCAAMPLVDVLGNSADPMGYGFSDGDPDAWAKPLAGTLTGVPWAPGKAQVLCELRDPLLQQPYWYDPRWVLQQVVSQLHAIGLYPVVAVELEFYLLEAKRSTDSSPIAASSPRSGEPETMGKVLSIEKLDEFNPVLDAIIEASQQQAIPVSTIISEYGAGQFEVNLEHQPDPLLAADHALLLRRAIKGVTRSLGLDATFMSKPFAKESGNGMHIHISLLNEQGENVFSAEGNRSPIMGQAIAGLQATMAEAMAFFAPHLNVYRRFKPDEFTPVTSDWGENNRSMAFRIPIGSEQNRRIEHRVSGADANPYLVMAAVLAGLHHGISQQLQPSAAATGNAGSAIDVMLPLTLWQALDRLQNAVILPGYFGADYLQIYREVKQAEFTDFMDSISAREHAWYL